MNDVNNSMEKVAEFDPYDRKYRNVRDLPPEVRDSYVDVPDREGFVLKSALEKFRGSQRLAKQINDTKGPVGKVVDKLLGKNETALRLLQQEATRDDQSLEVLKTEKRTLEYHQKTINDVLAGDAPITSIIENSLNVQESFAVIEGYRGPIQITMLNMAKFKSLLDQPIYMEEPCDYEGYVEDIEITLVPWSYAGKIKRDAPAATVRELAGQEEVIGVFVLTTSSVTYNEDLASGYPDWVTGGIAFIPNPKILVEELEK